MAQEELISFDRATIVGPGLLGASFGMCIREKKIADQIWTFARNENKREICEKSEWCDRALSDLKVAVSGSDLVILCTPVDTIRKQLPEICKWVKRGCMVTDVGSLKKEICTIAENLFYKKESFFIGSHPMAGSEKEGMEYASSEIFKHRNCILTPSEYATDRQIKMLTNMWQAVGMQVTEMKAEKHDEMVAWISHLPHVAASALINSLCSQNSYWMEHSGNGLRDTTRIASGNPTMWKEILAGNKKNIAKGIERLITQLNDFKQALVTDREDELYNLLDLAKKMRDQLKDD